MPRPRNWAGYLFGLALGLIVCASCTASQAAESEWAASRPPYRVMTAAELDAGAPPRTEGTREQVSRIDRKARQAQRVAQGAAASASQGTEFWLIFPGNLARPELTLFITGNASTTGTVSTPGLQFSTPFTVRAGTVTTVTLPPAAALDSPDVVEKKGIRVTALNDVTVYGFAHFDSYGYPGGMSLAPVAIVTRLDLTEAATDPSGTLHCVTATVSDQEGNPVGGVRVDFNVSGVNPTAGFAATAEDGRGRRRDPTVSPDPPAGRSPMSPQ